MSFTALQNRAAQIMEKYNYAQLIMGFNERWSSEFYQNHKAEIDGIATRDDCIRLINSKASTYYMPVDVPSWLGLTEQDLTSLWQLFLEWRATQ